VNGKWSGVKVVAEECQIALSARESTLFCAPCAVLTLVCGCT
jgi:hypothetical protein